MTELAINPMSLLEEFGPQGSRHMSVEQAQAWCRRLATGRYENFSVLSALVPKKLRDDFAAVYAFCRWADDLGDETGDRERSLELLAWWRTELNRCFDGAPAHPVFIALLPALERHNLPIEPFDALIRAFEQDQRVVRYSTWDELLEYCRLSADPVGRLVLMMCGEPRTSEFFSLSDCICTALQMTNHWQDVCRDVLQRNRIYIPQELIDVPDFESRLRASAARGHGVDREFLEQSRHVIPRCIEKTWPLFARGERLLDRVSPRTKPLIWLFAAGGERVLREIELWNYETALHRPKLSRPRKLKLVAQAWWMARRGARQAVTT
jgi:squalene synthase HpnC